MENEKQQSTSFIDECYRLFRPKKEYILAIIVLVGCLIVFYLTHLGFKVFSPKLPLIIQYLLVAIEFFLILGITVSSGFLVFGTTIPAFVAWLSSIVAKRARIEESLHGTHSNAEETSTENDEPTTNTDVTSRPNEPNDVPSEPIDTKEADTTPESNTNLLTIGNTNKETSSSSGSVETPPDSEPVKDSSVSPPTFASRQPLEPNKKLSVSISPSFKDCFYDSFTEIDENEPYKKTMYDMLTYKLSSRRWIQMDLERVGLLLFYIDVIDFEKLENKNYNTWITKFYYEIGQNGLSIIGESKVRTLFKSREVSFDKTFDFLYKKYLEIYPEGKGPIRFTKSTKQTPQKTQ